MGDVSITLYTEQNYDFFYIYDSNNNEVYRDSGEKGTLTINLSNYSTQKIKFRFTSDGSVVKDGVKVNSISCITPTCPSSPPSYPTDKWDRVWCNKNFDTWLGDTPDESSTVFDTNWGTGSVGGIRSDDIGFRSGRSIYFSAGYYEFSVGSDDGVKVWIGGTLALDRWQDRSYTVDKFIWHFPSSGYRDVRIDYYENTGDARVSFDYRYLPVILYKDINYGGDYLGLTSSDADLSDNTGSGCLRYCDEVSCYYDWNDCASSLKVSSGYTAILFENSNYGGRSIAFTSDVSDLRNYNFNDVASSVKVIWGVAPCATTDTNYMCSVSCGGSGTSSYISSDSPGYWKFTLTSPMNVTITTNTPSSLNSRLLVGTTLGGSDICSVNAGGYGSSESCNKLMSQGTYYITIMSAGGSGNDYPTISCTTPPTTCDATNYTSCDSAYNFGTSSGSKSYMCGNDQYYTVLAPSGKKCKITWTVTPDSSSDYDLYVKWSGTCPSTSDYDCKSTRGTGSTDSCTSSEKVLGSYALVHKHSGSGYYNISVSVTDCEDADCISCVGYTANTCWRKLKDQNCNDVDWYDFNGISFPKCAIKAQPNVYYDYYTAWDSIATFCPDPNDVMWKAIQCGGGWPSGSFSDGEVCKVWYLEWGNLRYKEGVWDPDDNKCIITNDNGNPYPGCTANHRENSSASYAADYCGSSGYGDGQCEAACGASPECDERYPNQMYDLDGDGYNEVFCDSNCIAHICNNDTICNSITYYGYTYKCTRYWISSSNAVWWWTYWSGDMNYLESGTYGEQECTDGYDNDCDGYRDCRDSGCRGIAGCCYYDSDCPVNQSTHIIGRCCSPGGTARPQGLCEDYDYMCKYVSSCRTRWDCENGYCCTREGDPGPGESEGRCVGEGTIINDVYLCDPVEGWGKGKEEKRKSDLLALVRETLGLFGLGFQG